MACPPELSATELLQILKGENDSFICQDPNLFKGGKFILIENICNSGNIIISQVNLPIIFRSGQFNQIQFDDTSLSTIIIEGGVFSRLAFSRTKSIHSSIQINGGVIKEAFTIEESIINELTITGGTINQVQITSSSISHTSLHSYTSYFGSSITNGTYKIISLVGDNGKTVIKAGDPNKKLAIGTLEISLPSTSKNNISVNINNPDVKVETIMIGDIGKDASLRIHAQKVRNIFFSNALVLGHTSLTGLRFDGRDFESVLTIINSDIGKTQFIDCDFSEYKLIFRNSKISDAFLAGTLMPQANKINPHENDEGQVQLVLNQIKKTYEARSDSINASKYFSDELNSHYRTLTWESNPWAKFVLLMNRVSTNHGQSWQQGVLSTLICAAFFYIFYLLSLGIQTSSLITNAKQFTFLFLEFINPLHKSDYIPSKMGMTENRIPLHALAIENLSKIFISYFLYQFIQAFRKYGKR